MAQNKAKAKKEQVKRWSNGLNGVMKVFAREIGKGKNKFTAYSTTVSVKNPETEKYSNMYFDVRFKKGEEPEIGEKGTDIMVKDGFISFREYEADEKSVKIPVIVILDYSDDEDDLPF